jgi:hypothetical protein
MSMSWVTNDAVYVQDALREFNFRQPAYTKPAENFGQLSPENQSWVLMRAAELKTEASR